MTNDIVARVGLAIHRAQQEAMERANETGVLNQSELDQIAARAAIEETLRAVREPPLEVGDKMRDMTGAGYPYSPDPIPPLGHLQISLIWHTGIDQLLSSIGGQS